MKRSVLPILAALGLVWAAFACASASASLTVLCKANEQPCQAKNIYPKGTAIVAETTESTGPLKLPTYAYTLECPSKFEATVGASGGESLPLSVSSWSLGNKTDYCDAIAVNNCGESYTPGVISAEGLPYSPTVKWSEGNVLKVTPSWHISCTFGTEFLNCTLHGQLALGLGLYGESLSASEQEMDASGYACPGNPRKLSVTLKIVKPETEVYVSYGEPPVAVATTKAASNITATKAKLNGTVNPKGFATNYWFEYGTTESYGTKTEVKSAGSGSSDVAVSKTVTGLTSGTTYDYRVVAENEFGLKTYGGNMTVVPGGPPTYRSSFGEGGSGEGQFYRPGGIAVDASGNLWVVDKSNNRIEEWSSSSKFLFAFGEKGTEKGKLSSPSSVAVDSSGNLWVADTGNNRIEEFNSKGEVLLAFGKKGGEIGRFRNPEAVAIDVDGKVWVADTGNARLQEFNSKGEFLTEEREGFCEPTGLAFKEEFLYVADRCKNRISEYYVSGGIFAFVFQWGEQGGGNGQFNSPDTLAADSEGNVWVIDEENERVQEFTGSGEYITKFGSWGSEPGQFEFHYPGGIAVDSGGNVWIADSLNNRVQKWSR